MSDPSVEWRHDDLAADPFLVRRREADWWREHTPEEAPDG
jgi:hypothetical protein